MLKFAGEVEADGGEVVLRHLQDVVGVGKEDVASLGVGGDVLVLAFFECFEGGFVVGFDPARFVQRDGFPAALCAVFVEEAVLDDFELELSDGADDFASVELVGEELGYAFVHELVYAFVELLGFHRVGVLDVFEHFGGEAGQSFEVDFA